MQESIEIQTAIEGSRLHFTRDYVKCCWPEREKKKILNKLKLSLTR
jgi:hypothetical protein